MSGDLVEFPVEVEVTPERYGTLRSVNVVSGDDIPPELDSQEWRLEEISVESHVRDQIDIAVMDETAKVGVVRVDPGTLEWEFTEE
ncbi:hypothetical protein EXE43_20865 [Halorubrum sp. SS5]|uniref:hypothetical protein n=1 Tax=Halorubrum sp. SS7 TaxID=2518119 RepID=UPI0010F4E186|nr:hypothetical protein [Halorubrum sp. SS7]TKX55651.1 hypothetical protein EXE44_16155 [Halorubrum sp. SS7]TKX84071.1 hypothetical protein EXE43_20865 [Halorubrum sp. SS5]